MRWGWVDVAEVVEVLRDRSGSRHVVVTGRNDGGHRSDGGATWQRLRVSGRKVGPGYIDPSYHAVAAGRPGRNRTRGW